MIRECITSSHAEDFLQQGGCQFIPVSDISFKCGKRLDKKKVRRIASHLEDGGKTYPLDVKMNGDGKYHPIGESRHILTAHQKTGTERVLCRIVD